MAFMVTVWPENQIANETQVSDEEIRAAVRRTVDGIRAVNGEHADEVLIAHFGVGGRLLETISREFGVVVLPWQVEQNEAHGPASLTDEHWQELIAFTRATMWPTA